ncbi:MULTISPECIES: hypothetical protein [Leptospira]|uniref:Uncharacterized protein n=6 Tax=Leptospira santarosai TaxID=28183 RepID=A0AB73LMR4_9LEPT|nr:MULTISPECIES: hypothetical protein [Leptospira]EMO58169.1 hypothetical protein LEP1GSC161_1485 [Leptospira santarosai str. CBC1416]ASV13049.1 hypothetical protein B2G51_17225 [Leptospira santarosai]AVV50316.1 Uncharacterized protein XB17_01728 [Leptospira santarosai]AVV77904.1 Uncharacterized protein XB15_00099 [Leptospira santarosai]EKO34507.1 hypothetical protein LEP1GSC179_3316 [Leptospira santarosai str. MOR084]
MKNKNDSASHTEEMGPVPAELEEKLHFFEEEPPNPTENMSVPPDLKRRVMVHIIPVRHIKIILFGLFFLGFSPLSVLFFLDLEFLVKTNLLPFILVTSSILFCVFSILAGIYLVYYRNPYTKEWKNKLGFFE